MHNLNIQLVLPSASLWISFQFKDEGVAKPALLAEGHKPWLASRCNDSISRKFFSSFSDQRLENSKGMCCGAELQ